MKAVIFDLDGVIVCTDNLHYIAWKKLADREGIFFDEIINNRLRGVSRMDSLDIILEKSNRKYTRKEKEKLTEYKNEVYKKLLSSISEKDIIEGMTDLLLELRRMGLKIGIGSSSKNAKQILKKIGLLNFFDCISDGTNITKSKPNPEVFIKAGEMLCVDCCDCVVIEDSLVGITAAKKAGMIACAVGDAIASREKDLLLSDLIHYLG